jgi:hypothetical protein
MLLPVLEAAVVVPKGVVAALLEQADRLRSGGSGERRAVDGDLPCRVGKHLASAARYFGQGQRERTTDVRRLVRLAREHVDHCQRGIVEAGAKLVTGDVGSRGSSGE